MNLKPFVLFLLSLLTSLTAPRHALAQPTDVTQPINNSKLSDQQIQNLFAFAKVYGYVKYFYPLQKKDKINWSRVAADGSQRVLNVNSEEDLAAALRTIFQPIAPFLQIHSAHNNIRPTSKESSRRYYYNLHKGLGQDKADLPILTRKISGLYKSQLMEAGSQTYLDLVAKGRLLSADSLYSAQLTDKLHCSFPLVLTEGDFKSNKAYKHFGSKHQLNLDLHEDRLATIIIFWNVMQHFYPYLDHAAAWDGVFVQTMQQLSPTMNRAEFMRAARKLTTSLNDGHAYLASTNSTGIYKLPSPPILETAWVENKLVVSKVNIENTSILPGDIIQKVGHQGAAELLEYTKGFLSHANPNNSNLLAAQSALGWLSTTTDTITMVLLDSNGKAKNAVLHGQGYQFKAPTPTAAIHALRGGVYYVNTSTVSAKDIRENLIALQQSEGIVFDMRSRPSHNFLTGVLPYLIDEEVETGNWSIPHYTFPDQKNVHFVPASKWNIKPNGSYLSAKKAFIIGHNTQSYGETCAEIIDHYKIGTLVGGSTAGTNGDVNFSGAGQLQVVWTGKRVLKRDGSAYHGVGVIPDVLIQPGLKDLQLGKDTQLEAAVELLQQKE